MESRGIDEFSSISSVVGGNLFKNVTRASNACSFTSILNALAASSSSLKRDSCIFSCPDVFLKKSKNASS